MTQHIGAELADSLKFTITGHPGYRMLLDIIHDENIIWLYKGHLAMSSPKPAPCRFPRLKLLAIPAGLFLKHLRNGWVRRPKVQAKAAVPCLWGVFKEDGRKEIAGVRRFTDDMYLYGEHFKAGDIVHIFGDWDIPEKGKREWREAMDESGIPYVDRKNFGVNGRLLRLTLRATWKVLRSLFAADSGAHMSPEIWRASIKGLYHYILKHYEMENVEYRAEVVKNDYNPGHVAATIAANQAGRKRIGVSHVSSAVDSPQICFVHFDKYATVCPMQEKWHGRFWDGFPIERVGGLSIDSVVHQYGQRRKILARLNQRYPTARKRTVLVLFPGDAERCLVPQWEKMHRALLEFSRTDTDARIFLRFRRLTEALKVPYMARIAQLAAKDSRFVLEHEEFNTHELMAVSDLVITANASFAINEALAIGKPVFTFDYTLKADKYFGQYGSEFILDGADAVMRTLESLKSRFSKLPPPWDRMREDADYFHDGKNRERLALAVKEMVA